MFTHPLKQAMSSSWHVTRTQNFRIHCFFTSFSMRIKHSNIYKGGIHLRKDIFLLSLFLTSAVFAETVEIDKRFALKMLVASYVNGFKEFDTTVVGYDNRVSIGIYVERDNQSRKKAEQLATRFKEQIPKLLDLNSWASGIKVVVTVY